MNRIEQLFQSRQEGILSVYFTAGYPRLSDTVTILEALRDKGVDMAEIGIPFSDPMADGPVIQEASTRALRGGMTLSLLLEQLELMRPKIDIPVILMGYLNPIMQYGFENLCRQCAARGVDGLIIPDLPFADYMASYKSIADQYDLKIIMLITPQTAPERIRLIDDHTSGFIYMVSSAATTGAQKTFGEETKAYFRRVGDMHLANPCLVGFGVSNKETFDAALAYSRGAIIGSYFIQLLGAMNIENAVDTLLASIAREPKRI
ncbi:MAG: tryptophan synthase subunit alpha [Tannerellaceae bacterium]|jgi:tryptophan synthase alpha chain|nr:tryptophan synthase subunit alpha [Tannerellaceae bacterium]